MTVEFVDEVDAPSVHFVDKYVDPAERRPLTYVLPEGAVGDGIGDRGDSAATLDGQGNRDHIKDLRTDEGRRDHIKAVPLLSRFFRALRLPADPCGTPVSGASVGTGWWGVIGIPVSIPSSAGRSPHPVS